GRQLDVGRLVHAKLADKVGADRSEVDAAVTSRGRNVAAVIERVDKVLAEAADADAARVAAVAVALDGNAGQALHRGRDVRIRELADGLGRNRIDDARGVALDVEI